MRTVSFWKANLKDAKELGVKDVCFAKRRGLSEEEMCRSNFVYKGLRKFRAGIEAGISWLKRSFGMDRFWIPADNMPEVSEDSDDDIIKRFVTP